MIKVTFCNQDNSSELSSLSREPRAALERGGNALRNYVVKHM